MTATPAPADTAPNSSPLRLAAGKYYRTRSGLKAGPVERLSYEAAFGEQWAAQVEGYERHYMGNGVWHPDRTPDPLDIVSEWTADRPDPAPSPVRTVAIPRTEILPGTYGIVYVMAGGYMGVLERNDYTPAELRAAAQTLIDLAEGLDRIAAERNAG